MKLYTITITGLNGLGTKLGLTFCAIAENEEQAIQAVKREYDTVRITESTCVELPTKSIFVGGTVLDGTYAGYPAYAFRKNLPDAPAREAAASCPPNEPAGE